MKRTLLAFATLFFALHASAITYTITDSGTTFVPDSITITQGDDVLFNLTTPNNAQEVSQADWLANNSTPITGFTTPAGGGLVTGLTTGTHYYICSANAGAGMKGRIVVLPPPPVIQFVVTSSSISEGAGTWNVAVSITNPDSLNATSVDINVAPGATATAGGVDYSFSPLTVTFPANDPLTKNVTITLNNDQQVEGNENFTLKLAFPTNNAVIGANTQHTVTIVDNDTLQIGIYPPIQSQFENVGSVNIPVELSNFSANATSVTVHLESAGTTATQGSDFIFADTTITWAGNNPSLVFIPITVIDDNFFEQDETVRIRLINPTNGAVFLNDTFLLVIQNNDAVAPATIRFIRPDTTVVESAGAVAVIAEVNNPTNNPVTFILARNDAASSATVVSDYTYQNISFTDGGGLSYDTVYFNLIDETLIEATEDIQFVLLPVSGSIAIVQDSTFTAHILDNDTLSVSFNGAGFSYVEDADTVYIRVTISSTVPDTTRAIISLAAGNAVNGVDFRFIQDTVTFLPNTADTQNVQVVIIDDAIVEVNEQANFNLTNLTTNARLMISAYTLTIIDNDAPSGITDEDLAAGLKVYPNPVANTLFIASEGNLAAVQITDLAGQVVIAAGAIPAGTKSVDVSALPGGMYFINVITENNVYSKRFIKQN